MKQFLFASALSILFLSCDDKEKSTENALTKETLLTEKAWILSSLEEKEGNSAWEDVFVQLVPCIKDNTIKFEKNGDVIYAEGEIACQPNRPNDILERQKWTFNTTKSAIVIDGIEFKIIELSKGKLVTVSEEMIGGIKFETRASYRQK